MKETRKSKKTSLMERVLAHEPPDIPPLNAPHEVKMAYIRKQLEKIFD